MDDSYQMQQQMSLQLQLQMQQQIQQQQQQHQQKFSYYSNTPNLSFIQMHQQSQTQKLVPPPQYMNPNQYYSPNLNQLIQHSPRATPSNSLLILPPPPSNPPPPPPSVPPPLQLSTPLTNPATSSISISTNFQQNQMIPSPVGSSIGYSAAIAPPPPPPPSYYSYQQSPQHQQQKQQQLQTNPYDTNYLYKNMMSGLTQPSNSNYVNFNLSNQMDTNNTTSSNLSLTSSGNQLANTNHHHHHLNHMPHLFVYSGTNNSFLNPIKDLNTSNSNNSGSIYQNYLNLSQTTGNGQDMVSSASNSFDMSNGNSSSIRNPYQQQQQQQQQPYHGHMHHHHLNFNHPTSHNTTTNNYSNYPMLHSQYSPIKKTTNQYYTNKINNLKNVDVGEIKQYIRNDTQQQVKTTQKHKSDHQNSNNNNNNVSLNSNATKNNEISEMSPKKSSNSQNSQTTTNLSLPKYMRPKICKSPLVIHLVNSKRITKPQAHLATSPPTSNNKQQSFKPTPIEPQPPPMPPLPPTPDLQQRSILISNNNNNNNNNKTSSLPPPPPPSAIPPPPPPPSSTLATSSLQPPGQRPISPPRTPPPILRLKNENQSSTPPPSLPNFQNKSSINNSLLNSLLNSTLNSERKNLNNSQYTNNEFDNSFNNSFNSTNILNNSNGSNSTHNNSIYTTNNGVVTNNNYHALLISPNLQTLFDKKKPPPPYPGKKITNPEFKMDIDIDEKSNESIEMTNNESAAISTNIINTYSNSSIQSNQQQLQPPPPQQQSVVRYCSPQAYKFFMEQHAENILKHHKAREYRRYQLENEMTKVDLTPSLKEQMRLLLKQKENNYLRLRRAKMNKAMFEHLKVLGIGAFGEVNLVRKRDDMQRLYAMKILHKSDVFNRNQAAHVKAERDILAEADNEWVVKLYYSFQDEENLYFVMDYVPGGDLMNLLIKLQIFSEELSRFYIGELTCAIESVHNLGFIHRDIKPDNILIDKYGHIKLTDFGLCTGFHWTHNSKYYRTGINILIYLF